MGMYTGLRCKVVVKPEYRQEIHDLMYTDATWVDLDSEVLWKFSGEDRADFIPFGILCSMPDEWEQGFDNHFDKDTGLWVFKCSLKNYRKTIESFLKHVLSEIAQTVIHLEAYYEEWNYSISYKLENGNIVEDNKRFKQYRTNGIDNWQLC